MVVCLESERERSAPRTGAGARAGTHAPLPALLGAYGRLHGASGRVHNKIIARNYHISSDMV